MRSGYYVGMFALLISVGTSACSSDSAGSDGSGGTGGSQVPDSSADGIAAFIASKQFEQTGWTAETSTARDASSVVSPHGKVRVYLNDSAVQAQQGVSSPLDVEYAAGAMAVKEMYDPTGPVGYAVMLKTEDGKAAKAWTYWCYAPDSRCGVNTPTAADAEYGAGISQCSSCHGSKIFTLIP